MMRYLFILLTVFFLGFPSSGPAKTILTGALAMTYLNRVVLDSNDRPVKEERLLLDLDERIRDVIESPEVWLYVSTDSGRILRIKPSSG